MLPLSLCGGWVGWGMPSHFRVQPIYDVDVVIVLCCCWGCDNIRQKSKWWWVIVCVFNLD